MLSDPHDKYKKEMNCSEASVFHKAQCVFVSIVLVFYNLSVWPERFSQHRNLLWAGWSAVRNAVGPRFSSPFQTGPGAHPTYTIGTGIFNGVKWPGHGISHPPTSSAKIKEGVGLCLYSPLGLCGLSQGELFLFTATVLLQTVVLEKSKLRTSLPHKTKTTV
jgi:hypothetical protein